ncbi:hypothetical protein GCG54_00013417 [Colletotrichum gloeosporioides]|uniref:Uncharacterized protein n=1 Tax=Colletotrichum gloeosporioides TaxID=474922 RepID=A0A8H4CGN4_COLGL|nr:uncharacterized protein GCG54_00013417 [Colletotrichum gloeosporioides]KAF3803307.1 hypothetical protein GCG54_00013417 [Colletotrichum gloeosporioides]
MKNNDHWDDMGLLIKGERAGRWGQLQRRYGLALHLCKMRLLDGKLSDLLWNTWDREAKDRRDKVFAVLGLVGKNKGLLLKPDYSKSVRQVFCETARDVIRMEDKLDILLAANGTRNDVDGVQLPSWVPDWRKEAHEARPVMFVNRARLISPFFGSAMEVRQVFGHGYAACADEKPVVGLLTILTLCILMLYSLTRPAVRVALLRDLAQSSLAYFLAHYALASSKSRPRSDLPHIVDMTLWADSTTSDAIQNLMPLRQFFVTKYARYICIGPAAL